MRKYLLPATSIAFIILISAFPVQSLNGAQYGLSAFLGTVMPALLPFFAATTMLIRSGACDWIAAIFKWAMRIFRLPGDAATALVVSLLSGYPAGAKAVNELHGAGRLNGKQAQVAYVLCSTTGPAFILGTIGVMISANCSLYLMLPHYLSAVAAGIIAGYYVNPEPQARAISAKAARKSDSPAVIIVDAISSTASGLWKVASYMMFFSSLTFVLAGTGVLDIIGQALGYPLQLFGLQPEMGITLISGMLEMTQGCIAAAFSNAGFGSVLPMLSFIISFGGLSILMQVFTFTEGTGTKFSMLLCFKLIQGLVSMLFTAVLLLVFPPDMETFAMAAPLAGKAEISILGLLLIAALPLGFAIVSMIRNKGYKKRRV